MANYTNLNDLFTAMANAIREKKNSTATIIADTFPTEIESLRTGFDYSNQNVVAIPDYAFYGCEDLNSVDCYNLTRIGASAFENCNNLKRVILYDGVESVGENAFKGCSDDLVIYCMFENQPEGWNENWNPDEREVIWLGGAIETWDISATEDDNVTAKLYNEIHNDGMYLLFINGNGNMRNYMSYNSSMTTTTPWKTKKCEDKIKSVTISDSVTTIGNNAFRDCISLTSVTILNNVTSISEHAFYGCTSLTSITIPNSVTSISIYAFYGCISLTSVTIPNSVTSISSYAFQNCTALTSITIPDSVTSIDGNAFQHCTALTSITIPDSVTSIGGSAFYHCTSLTSITIPDSVTSIGGGAFDNTAYYKNSSNWENNVLYIDNCLIKAKTTLPSYYEIKDKTLVIGGSAFFSCTSLTSIIIPDSVTSIGGSAFYHCTSLTSITYTGTIAQWNAITFETNWNTYTGNYTIHCTDGDIAKDGTITYHATT